MSATCTRAHPCVQTWRDRPQALPRGFRGTPMPACSSLAERGLAAANLGDRGHGEHDTEALQLSDLP